MPSFLSGSLAALGLLFLVVGANSGAMPGTVTLPPLSNVFSSKSTIANPSEGVSTLLEVYMDGTRGRMLQNWSSPFGFSAQLLLGDLQEIYLLYLINETLTCLGGSLALPRTFPPPNFAALGQPTGVMVTGLGRPAYRFDFTTAKYIASFLIDQETGLPSGSMSAEVDFTSTLTFSYTNGTVTDPLALEPPAVCNPSTPAPAEQFHGGTLPFRPGRMELSADFLETLTDPLRVLLHHFGVAPPQAVGNPVVPTPSEFQSAVERYAAGAVSVGESASWLLAPTDLPASVDNSPFATPVRNQGAACGACWAFASAAAAEVVYRKAQQMNRTYDVTTWLSVQTLIDCAHDGPNSTAPIPSKGCQGGWPSTALDFVVRWGLPQEHDYAFQGVTGRRCHLPGVLEKKRPMVRPISSHYATPYLNTSAMMDGVYRHGAVVAIINFFLTPNIGDAVYAGGVYSNAACTPGFSHAIAIVGYGTSSEGVDYWLVKNSMGPAWGEAGYFKIARGINMCGVEDFGFVPVY